MSWRRLPPNATQEEHVQLSAARQPAAQRIQLVQQTKGGQAVQEAASTGEDLKPLALIAPLGSAPSPAGLDTTPASAAAPPLACAASSKNPAGTPEMAEGCPCAAAHGCWLAADVWSAPPAAPATAPAQSHQAARRVGRGSSA